ncbi:MAG TPA: FAD-dependent oxidoreductase [Marmoricola sp.]|nr:FAD-dependent oxidoreductase [Marmoricola sp.]
MTTSPSDVVDVVVVGAGPAGLASATAAGTRGASVALVDAGAAPGGQYWRHPATARLGAVTAPGVEGDKLAHLHHGLRDYRRLVDLLARHVEAGTTRYLSQHHVWTIERHDEGFAVHAVDRSGASERAVEVRGRRLVLAPGAYDRQVPFPGWTLPGVMTAGGAQALLKGNGVVAGSRVVVAGTGPFLLPVAAGLARAGAEVVGVHEASSARAWLRHVGAVLRNADKLGEGLGYARGLARHKVPVRSRSVLVAAHGDDRLSAVTVARAGRDGVESGTEQVIECDTLAVGWGFTPQLELPLELGCETRVDTDGSVVCVVDDDQQGSVPGVFVAGEACGVGGAVLALVEGAIAGAAAAGVPVRDPRLRRQRSALRSFAAAMHAAHPVPTGWADRLTDDTIVCRCEEVSAVRLRAAVDAGAGDARTAKLLARPGMGWCQGRVCGYATACLTAAWSGTPYRPELVGTRPVAAPVSLGVIGDRRADAPPSEDH